MRLNALKGKVALGYTRSSGQINPKDSIPNQIQMIRDFCQEHGLYLKEVLIDSEKTGTTTEGRTDYKKLRERIRAQKVEVVLTTFMDRLGRESYELIDVTSEMKQYGIEFIAISERLQLSQMSAPEITMRAIIYEYENNNRTQRIKNKKEQSIQNGEYIRRLPYGYKKDKKRKLFKDPTQAKTICDIFTYFDRGSKYSDIAEMLNKKGITTSTGKKWDSTKIYQVLNKDIYVGLIDENGIYFPGIVQEPLFYSVKEKLNKSFKKTIRSSKQKHFHLLSRILLCPVCDRTMVSEHQTGSYNCKQCRKKSKINKKEVDIAFLNHLKSYNSNKDDTVHKGIYDFLNQKERLEQKFALSEVSLREFEKKHQQLQNAISRIKTKTYQQVLSEATNDYFTLASEGNLEELKKQLDIAGVKVSYCPKTKKIELILNKNEEIVG